MRNSNPLVTDRFPFLLIERGRVKSVGSTVFVEKGDKRQNLPIRSTHLLILGNGTSITSEAMSICAKNGCYLAQSKGGLSIHSVLHSGIYPNPKRLTNQVLLSQDQEKRLKIAKYIAKKKFESMSLVATSDIENCTDIPQILGIEGFLTKIEYKRLYGDAFYRAFDGDDVLNKNINVINSVFYSFVATVIVALGYSPSIGFLHGHSRRGALVFDITDMFKHSLYLSNIDLLKSNKNMARELSSILSVNKNRAVKEIIFEIEAICGGLT